MKVETKVKILVGPHQGNTATIKVVTEKMDYKTNPPTPRPAYIVHLDGSTALKSMKCYEENELQPMTKKEIT